MKAKPADEETADKKVNKTTRFIKHGYKIGIIKPSNLC